MLLLPIILALGVAPAPAAGASTPPAKVRRARTVSSAKEARDIAEQETGGVSVSARKIALNGATGGYEVLIHLPQRDHGWRCVVDNDTRSVHSKSRIPNPDRPGRRR